MILCVFFIWQMHSQKHFFKCLGQFVCTFRGYWHFCCFMILFTNNFSKFLLKEMRTHLFIATYKIDNIPKQQTLSLSLPFPLSLHLSLFPFFFLPSPCLLISFLWWISWHQSLWPVNSPKSSFPINLPLIYSNLTWISSFLWQHRNNLSRMKKQSYPGIASKNQECHSKSVSKG